MPLFGPKTKQRLKDFKKVVIDGLLARPTPQETYQDMFQAATNDAGPRAPLSADESTLLSSIFGTEFLQCVDIVKHHAQGFTNCPPASAGGSIIHFYGTERHLDDYSKASPDLFGTFVHEATHVWQSWTGHAFTPVKHLIYNHTLKEGMRFSDFGIEQQATVMQNYARRFLHPDHMLSTHVPWADTPETDKLLQDIVEGQFPAARETRLALNLDSTIVQKKFGEPLSETEAAMIRDLFDGKIDTGIMRRHFGGEPENFGYDFGTHAHFTLPWAKDEPVLPRRCISVMLAEATRLWQHQRGLAARAGQISREQDMLTPATSFDDLSNNGQVLLVFNYMMDQANAQIEKIVEERLPAARSIRQRLPALPNPSTGPKPG